MSVDTKSASVVCPAGKRVHGAGGDIFAPAGVAITVVYPFNDFPGMSVSAEETTPTSQNWEVYAWATCGP